MGLAAHDPSAVGVPWYAIETATDSSTLPSRHFTIVKWSETLAARPDLAPGQHCSEMQAVRQRNKQVFRVVSLGEGYPAMTNMLGIEREIYTACDYYTYCPRIHG
jgi:hypothetical protein